MTATAYFKPVIPQKSTSLCMEVRTWIAHHFNESHCLRSERPIILNTAETIPYLEGLRDACGNKDIELELENLISAIYRHGSVEFWIEP